MTFTFPNILVLLTILQLLFFSILFLSGKKAGRFSNVLIGLFYFSLAISIFNGFVFIKSDFFIHYPHFFFVGAPFAFLYAPLFYLYIQSLLIKKQPGLRQILIHALPFLTLLLYLSIFFYFKSASIKSNLLNNSKVIPYSAFIVLTGLLHAQILYYFIRIVRLIKIRHETYHLLKRDHTNAFRVIRITIASFLLLWSIDLLRFLGGFLGQQTSYIIEVVLYCSLLAMLYINTYKMLRQPGFFLNNLIQEDSNSNQNGKRVSLSDMSLIVYSEKLKNYMEKEKPFLNPELAIAELSDQTLIPVRSLSEVINQYYQQNFYEYINSYRILTAKELLSDPSLGHYSIADIMVLSGFNTKSTFNTSFKNSTGLTPTEYRKKYVLRQIQGSKYSGLNASIVNMSSTA